MSKTVVASPRRSGVCARADKWEPHRYDAETNPCDLTPVACDQDACEAIDGDWVESCPDPPPDCDPLAPSPDDPSCTGPPKGIDRFGKKMYARKLVARDKPQDNEDEGVFCHVTFDLCEGETMITQQIDSGFGDYYRVANAPGEWCDYEGTADYAFDGMHKRAGRVGPSPRVAAPPRRRRR